MPDRDTSPRAGGPADPRPDRDPTALAAWRRVAEQRRKRQVEPGEPEEPADPEETAQAVPVDGARPGPGAVAPPTAQPTARPTAPPTREDGGAGSRHDLLLALAGRLDDDALSTVRELVAVDDAAAAEMMGGCLLADRVAVTVRERAQLDRWFAGARVDPDLLGALPTDPDAAGRSRHRFVADLPGVPTDDGEAVARAAARLSGVARVLQCWRVTPAGSGPGPLPHRVVLVEAESSEDCEHVAHHAVHAARSRAAVSVEVYARGADLPTYQRDAVAAAGSAASAASAAPAAPPAAVESSSPAVATAPALPVRRRPGTDVALSGPAPAGSGPSGAALGGDRYGAPRAAALPAAAEVPGVTGIGPAEPLDDLADPDDLDEAGELLDAEDPEDRRDTEGWRVVADSDRGPAPGGWSTPVPLSGDALAGPGAAGVAEGPAPDDGPPSEGAASITDLDPDAAAARIAALWREPSPVDAFDVPLRDDGWSPNLLEPDLPEPDLAHEMARYDAPRPVTGSFGRVDGPDGDPAVGPEPGDEPSTGAHARSGPDTASSLDLAGPDPWSGGRIRRARHSRAAADDDEPGPAVDHDVRFGAGADAPWRSGADVTSPVDLDEPAATTAPTPSAPRPPAAAAQDPQAPAAPAEPPTGPVSVAATGTTPAPPTTPPGATPAPGHPEAEDAMSQLSDRERELLSRLHAELAAREKLEGGEPDPFAARGGDPAPPPRPSPGPRPSPSPRRPASDDPDAVTQSGALPGRVNGHAHGPVNGRSPGRTNGHGPGDGHGPRNGHGLPPGGPGDEAG